LTREESKVRDLTRVQACRRRLAQLRVDEAARVAVESLLDDAIAIMGAAAGNIQALDPADDHLRLIASRGFSQPFLDFFDIVQDDENSTCAQAMRSGQRIWVENVAASPIFRGKDSGRVMREAGSVAVQSEPLLDRNGYLLGMISLHWHSPARPTAKQQRILAGRIGRTLDDLDLS
jgi:GAF domain-containing protein